MNGTYGTTKPATINPSEADVFYFYRPSWSTDAPDFTSFKRLPEGCLSKAQYAEDEEQAKVTLPGMYNLRLPMDKFNKKGIYTVYIKPKETSATIAATGSLVAFPDVIGIVFKSDEIGAETNNQFVGYRVDFLDENGNVTGYKIISSSNFCTPVYQNANNVSESGARYALSPSYESLTFCTLTPSASMSFTSNNVSDGAVGMNILLSSTKFNPVMVEIEMVEHDAETISTMLEGDQLRNLDMGTITTFNKDGGIYHQARYGNAVNPDDNEHYDFKVSQGDSEIMYNEEESLKNIKDKI